MNISRLRILGTLVLSIALAIPTLGHGTRVHRHHAKKRPPISAKARHLALERYRFLKRLEPKFGRLPIERHPGDTTAADVTIFPVGRSDRLYVFLWASGSNADFTATSQMFCYQHQDGKDQLVYQVKLEDQLRPANKVESIKSLMDYVRSFMEYDHLHSVSIVGTLSDLARQDLDAKRDYVRYNAEPFDGELAMTLLSSTKDNVFDSYNVTEDPYTKAPLKDDAFFDKYGLPVAQGELSLLR